MPVNTTKLERLIDSVKDAVSDPSRVEVILTEAMADRDDWLDARFQETHESDYALYPLYRAPGGRCSIVCVALKPGKPAPIHNHGAWAVIGIYKGRERDTWYRRVDDGTVPGRAQLEVEQAAVNDRGSVHIVPDGKIHTVEALDHHPAVSIHVYGTDILTQVRSSFDLEAGTEQVFQPRYEDA